MNCNHDNCFTCPYPDCVRDTRDACYSLEKYRERIQKRKAYQKKWYARRKVKEKAIDD